MAKYCLVNSGGAGPPFCAEADTFEELFRKLWRQPFKIEMSYEERAVYYVPTGLSCFVDRSPRLIQGYSKEWSLEDFLKDARHSAMKYLLKNGWTLYTNENYFS